jgi:hypothetical protein
MFEIDMETLCRPTATHATVYNASRRRTDAARTARRHSSSDWSVSTFVRLTNIGSWDKDSDPVWDVTPCRLGVLGRAVPDVSKARIAFTFTGRQSETLPMKTLEPINIRNRSCVITTTSHYKSSPLRKPQIVNYSLKNPAKQMTMTSSAYQSTSVALFLQSSIISEHWSFRLVQTL